jgi:hypothetical protein
MKRFAEAPADRVEIKVVGKSGQISLGKRFAGKTLRLVQRADGVMTLTAVAMVPESQLWTLEQPHRGQIERGLEWASATPAQETDLDGLVRRASRRKAGGRGRRC